MAMGMEKLPAASLHTRVALQPRSWVNRIFALIYSCAICALVYHHLMFFHNVHVYFSILILVADVVLAFMWATHQSFRMFPIRREVYPENLPAPAPAQAHDDDDDGRKMELYIYPAMDVFICTADPYKEPPMCVVNTALSVMAYDFPAGQLSVYVSDDGGSQLTMFALMEAAKFATHWLPYCRNNNILDRCPQAYFQSQPPSPQNHKIKLLYENMKIRVENVVEKGSVNGSDYNIGDEHEVGVFNKWMDDRFTSQDHPSIIQVVLDSGANRDITGHEMPNLIYVSRQKRKTASHHFKACALNVLRYDRRMFEFGVPSPMFFPVAMTAVINLIAFSYGIIGILRDGISYEDVFVQMFIAGFVVLNSWPIYQAMFLRTDKGKMPVKVSLISGALVIWILYLLG